MLDLARARPATPSPADPATDAYLEADAVRRVRELATFVAFPSVSSWSRNGSAMRACAGWLADKLRAVGASDARVMSTGGHPAVAGRIGNTDRPTILVYGHYDVQPPDPLGPWRSSPFRPLVRGGHLYGRGASDDKAQILAHIKAVEMLRELNGELPVNVIFLVDGEEEIGSPGLGRMIPRLSDYLACDAAVVSDMPILAAGRPAIAYATRGDVYLEVEVRAPGGDLHSGNFGGAVTNALRELVASLGQLHDSEGRVAVPGFYDDVLPVHPLEREYMRIVGPGENVMRMETGGAALQGESGYSSYERATVRPSLEIAGVSGGYAGSGVKGVIPSRATAKLDIRLVPRQRPDRVHRRIFE